MLTSFVSEDGVDWVVFDRVELPFGEGTSVGVAVTSRMASATAEALADHVTVRDGDGVDLHPAPVAPPVEGPPMADPIGPPDEPEDVVAPVGAWVCPSEPLQPAFEPTLFVATDGSDSADGRSIDRPLRTLQRAADLARAGDVVWVRGGTYSSDVTFRNSGTSTTPIVFESHPGECAILDGNLVSGTRRVTLAGVSYMIFRNFIVRNSPAEGIYLDNADHNQITHVETHDNYWSGITVANSDLNLFAYFISHDNFDPPYGGDADGINVNTGDRNRIDRCIVYDNSDDGVDTWRSTNTLVERCIAFDNGWQGGDGNGIKAGGGNDAYTIVRNTIAFRNKANGFDHNLARYVTFLNNTGFDNGRYNFVADTTVVLRNNLSYAAPAGMWGATHAYNSWNLDIDEPQFVSTDPNSPDFLRLAIGSPAIAAGTDVGLPYAGAAPDLGAIPHDSGYTDILGGTLPSTATYDAAAR
jgi:parallel beta-helix repeat protein